MTDEDSDNRVTIKFGGLTVEFDPFDAREHLSEEHRILVARALCWDEVLRQAALRLADESEDWDYDRDQRTRIEFLDRVKHRADDILRSEIESLNRKLMGVQAEHDRMFRALGGYGDNHDRHSRALRIARGETT